MNKILITGAGGFIGFNLSKFFLDKGYHIIGIDNFARVGSLGKIKYLNKAYKNFKFYKCDIINYKKLKHIISKQKNLKSIFHTAGQVTVTDSIIDPIKDFKINSLGTLYLLELTKKYHNKSKFIFSSTNKVYGNLKNLIKIKKNNKYFLKNYKYGINEDYSVDYCSPYGCSKGSADQYVIDFGRIFNMDTVVLRKSCIYGNDQFGIFGQGWISYIINQALLNKKITIFGDGFQTRDILFIDDLVRLYNKILQKSEIGSKVFNIGGGKNNLISVKDLIYFLNKKNLIKKNLRYSLERTGDQKTYYSDSRKAFKKYSWKPLTSKDIGLEKMLKYSVDNIKFIKKIYKYY